MKYVFVYILTFISVSSFAQDNGKDKEALLALKKANNYVYEGNEKVNDDFVAAEMAYRKALSEQASSVVGAYNLGTSYYQNENYTEALFRLQQAVKNATSKEEKHRAFHNIGNILMKEKRCKEAVEAYKNALRNDPTDDETRYNFGLAKECADQQQDDPEDENKDDENRDKDPDQNKDQSQEEQEEEQEEKNQDQGDNKDENKDQGDQDKKEGDDQKENEGKPNENKKDQGNKDENQQESQPKPGQLSPQQVKNLLEAMNNQEQKVQQKMNAEKQRGERIETDKDW